MVIGSSLFEFKNLLDEALKSLFLNKFTIQQIDLYKLIVILVVGLHSLSFVLLGIGHIYSAV